MGSKRIDWSRHFDAVFCLAHLQNTLRLRLIKSELERIGLLKSKVFQFEYTFQSKYCDILYAVLARNGLCRKILRPKSLNATLGHYSCIKKSAALGYDRILIIEDDMRFLKDLDAIKTQLKDIPSNADVVLFDKFVPRNADWNEILEKNKVNRSFVSFEHMGSTGCCMLSKKAVLKFSELYDQMLYPSDEYTSELVQAPEFMKYASIKNMACQATFSRANNILTAGNTDDLHNAYRRCGLDYSEYQMFPDGSAYDYGFCITE